MCKSPLTYNKTCPLQISLPSALTCSSTGVQDTSVDFASETDSCAECATPFTIMLFCFVSPLFPVDSAKNEQTLWKLTLQHTSQTGILLQIFLPTYNKIYSLPSAAVNVTIEFVSSTSETSNIEAKFCINASSSSMTVSGYLKLFNIKYHHRNYKL